MFFCIYSEEEIYIAFVLFHVTVPESGHSVAKGQSPTFYFNQTEVALSN